MVGALICAAGVWLYAERVLIPYQTRDAAAHGRPRGNLSDLYPRWVGARGLLLHGRDPYSTDVTKEIQAGYYGRALNSGRAADPEDQQGFAYPVYMALILAPTVNLPFEVVRTGAFWLFLILTAASVLLWLRILDWQCSPAGQSAAVLLTLGALPVVQGLKLEQISLLVAAMTALAVFLLQRGWAVAAGILLAFATIKPQLVILLLLWLATWTLADWRRRYRCALSFLVAMAALLIASEWYLPGWMMRFWQAAREYQRYTGAMGVMQKLVGKETGSIAAAVGFAAVLWVCWRERAATESRRFGLVTSVVLAFTVLLVPTFAAYNQVLLVPCVLLTLKEWGGLWRCGPGVRLLVVLTAALVCWPWSSSVVLAAISFLLPPEVVERAWAVPFWSSLFIPIGVAGVMLLCLRRNTFADSVGAGTS